MSPKVRPTLRRQQMLLKLASLKEPEIFRDLTPEEMEWVDSVASVKSCSKGEVFYRPEEAGEALFLIKEGKVQIVTVGPDGEEFVLATLGPGAIFGQMPAFGQTMYGGFARAKNECTVSMMTRATLDQILTSKPKVAVRIIESLANRLSEAEARLEDLAFKTIAGRLASLLLRLAEEHGLNIVGYTHQDLAEMIGSYRETTTQTLNNFKAKGLLTIGRKRLHLENLDGLRAIAEG